MFTNIPAPGAIKEQIWEAAQAASSIDKYEVVRMMRRERTNAIRMWKALQIHDRVRLLTVTRQGDERHQTWWVPSSGGGEYRPEVVHDGKNRIISTFCQCEDCQSCRDHGQFGHLCYHLVSVLIHAKAPHAKRAPMNYDMGPKELRREMKKKYPKGTTTLKLIQDGMRVATTRSYAIGAPGEHVFLYHEDDPFAETEVVVTAVNGLLVASPKLSEDERKAAAEEWSQKEGWSVDWLRKNPDLWGATQTEFRLPFAKHS
jgi:hypothetical protein